MKLALGMYTTLSQSAPAPAFKRALSLVYHPILRLLYNSEGVKFNLYQSSGVMKYFEGNNPEVNMLLSALCKRGDLEILSGSYSQSIIGLNMPKDRGRQIERMTTFIRKMYGAKAKTAFFYGQIWSPQFISTLTNCALSSVAISSYKATDKITLFDECSIMNELGKRVKIIPISDEIASLVSKFAQLEIDIFELRSETVKIIERHKEEDRDLFIFINIDQLLQAMASSPEEDEAASSFIPYLIAKAKEMGIELSHISELEAKGPCYLDSGWYGRDSSTMGLNSFNELFVKDGTNRYLLNRLFYTNDVLSAYKKDKDIKRECEDVLAAAGSGPLFIYDPQCGPLRSGEHELFWRSILSAEKLLFSSNEVALPLDAEFEEAGEGNYFSRNQNYTVVYSPFGGSIVEFDQMEKLINFFDAKSSFDKSGKRKPLKRSFSDTVIFDDESYESENALFELKETTKNRSDYTFLWDNEELPFSLEKHYKLRSQTFSLESTIEAKKDVKKGLYSLHFYLVVPDQVGMSEEQNKAVLFGQIENIRTMRAFSANSNLQLVFTSTSSFNVDQSVMMQSQFTVLGKERFNLYNKLTISFPFSMERGESLVFKMILRSTENKIKE